MTSLTREQWLLIAFYVLTAVFAGLSTVSDWNYVLKGLSPAVVGAFGLQFIAFLRGLFTQTKDQQ